MATYFYVLLFLHLIGASVWVGGHLVLAFGFLPEALRTQSTERLQDFEAKFERIGIPSLAIQIITGLLLAWRLQPDWILWFDVGSPFRGIGVKLILLGLTALLAIDARLRIIPHLKPENLNSLAWHIIPVTFIGVLFVFVGAFFRLGGL